MKKLKFAFHRVFLAIGALALVILAAATVFSQSYPMVPLQSYSQVVGTWEGEVTKASKAGLSVSS